MSQRVDLKFGNGSFDQGFPGVIAQVWEQEDQSRAPIQLTGSLPPAPELLKLYDQWRSLYLAVYQYRRFRRGIPGIELDASEEPLAVSDADLADLCQQLKRGLNQWLDSGSFGRIERQLRARLTPAEAVRVILETEDPQLRRLPWQLWNLFVDYPEAEVALSALQFNRIALPPRPPRKRVRILAILGHSQGIEVDQDRQILERLPNADTIFLVEPDRAELNRWLWHGQGWDILFFAGHSSSNSRAETGYIEINTRDRLSIDQLRNALKTAISNGLQLAIFNSCDGLGLGRSLADLQIPQLIVMREPVPDRVAQEFLTYWVTAFSQGKPFYQSVREARERLQGLEGEFPCACWLPVICQNPTAIPPTWQQLQHGREPIRLRDLLGRLQYPPVLGGLITVAVLGIRLLGGLETFELRAFDHLMRSRPSEAMDSRLLLITVTGNDVQAQDPQKRQGASLSNEAFDQLLKQLIPLKPRVIGVDIYREIPLGDRYPALLQQFQQNNRLINLCKVGDDANNPGIPPALEIPQPQIQSRVGFSDVVTDSDNVVRRHLLGMSFPENSACKVTTSLNLMLTMRYLSDEGIAFSTTSSQLQLGDLTLKEGREILTQNSGGYSRLDNYWGYQIMLNYRNTHSIAPEVTLTEALEGKRLTPELVRDKIVLIGTTDPSFRDLHQMALSRGNEVPGVLVQAHMVSQLVSAVKDGRPLIWWWPSWLEILWIGVWAGIGGAIAWKFRPFWKGSLILGTSFMTLYTICYLTLWKLGGWLPLVPAGLILLAVSMTIWFQQGNQVIKKH